MLSAVPNFYYSSKKPKSSKSLQFTLMDLWIFMSRIQIFYDTYLFKSTLLQILNIYFGQIQIGIFLRNNPPSQVLLIQLVVSYLISFGSSKRAFTWLVCIIHNKFDLEKYCKQKNFCLIFQSGKQFSDVGISAFCLS